MPEWLAQLMATLVTSAVSAALASRLTVRSALRQFREQKWWERKEVAYTAIIDAVHEVYRYAEVHFDAEIRGRVIDEEKKNELGSKFSAGLNEIRRARSFGSLVISPEADSILAAFEAEMSGAASATTWFEHLDSIQGAAFKCLNAIRGEAAKDLGVSKPKALLPIRTGK